MAAETYEAALAESKRFLVKSISTEERIAYTKGAIEVLEDQEQVKKLEQGIADVSRSAIQIDESFERTSRGFEAIIDDHGSEFPELVGFKKEWDGYRDRWVVYLWDSRDVASEMIVALRRYDQVFLEMIGLIATDQDCQEVVKELLNFSDENHPKAAQMMNNFKNLEADLRGFDLRFTTYVEQKQVEFEKQARMLQAEIGFLNRLVAHWSKLLADGLVTRLGVTTITMGAGLVLFGFGEMLFTAACVTYLRTQLYKSQRELKVKQAELEEINRKQKDLAELKTEFDILKPDFELICEQLMIFGDIWESIRTQCRDFSRHLEKGMEALDDEEFQLQVRLARKICPPLQTGLSKYATQLEHSSLSHLSNQ